ncbi:hypothetical protein HW115_18605 [Verrucomicrobiaceae bacterium N1E253]|uniref:Uncharacterized protein n=1 Tax=Oceaniferula marina TaxID=2748318 RepID=A0A851GR87_9BACT|nr:hypothetical protein [Oceaniferula marina]NWK57635.1 hypothetical protein [Oceaniferula marina]
MQKMKMSFVTEAAWDQAWEKYSSIEFEDDVLAIEQEEQAEIEELIASIVKDKYSLGFDWIVDHFNTPRYIFTVTLQNSKLFRRKVVEAIINTVTTFNDKWVLNLVLIDAIHGDAWDSTDQVASLLIAQDEGFILRHSYYGNMGRNLTKWIDKTIEA